MKENYNEEELNNLELSNLNDSGSLVLNESEKKKIKMARELRMKTALIMMKIKGPKNQVMMRRMKKKRKRKRQRKKK